MTSSRSRMERRKREILIVSVLSSGIAFIDLAAIGVLLPVLQESFGTALGPVQWVSEGFLLMLAALLLVGGALGDRYGRRRILQIGIGIFGTGALAAAAAPTVGWLVATRFLQGIGAALIIPASLALITHGFAAHERGAAFGVWAAVTGLTAAAGPALAGFLSDQVSWRAMFVFYIPFSALVLFWSNRLPDPKETDHVPPDWLGVVLAIVALGSLAFGLIEANRRPFAAPVVWGPLLLGVLASASFLWVEHRRQNPMMPLRLFRDRAFTGANVATLLLYAALGGLFFILPFHLIHAQDWSATAAGAATAPPALIMMVLARPLGKLSDRIGPRWPMTLGAFLWGLGLALLVWPGSDATYWRFLPGFVVMGIGMSALVPALTATVMSHVPEDQRGTASGINNTLARVAGLLSIAVFGLVAVTAFSHALPPEVAEALGNDVARLAAVEPPPGVGEEVIEAAFVYAFRVLMLIAAGFAWIGALVLWWTAPRGPVEGPPEA